MKMFGLEMPDMATSKMLGKVCLVTGASSGIGKVTASELADMGATVVMLCRSRTKGEAVQAEIKEASGNAHVDLIVADLSDLSEVRRAAHESTKNTRDSTSLSIMRVASTASAR